MRAVGNRLRCYAVPSTKIALIHRSRKRVNFYPKPTFTPLGASSSSQGAILGTSLKAPQTSPCPDMGNCSLCSRSPSRAYAAPIPSPSSQVDGARPTTSAQVPPVRREESKRKGSFKGNMVKDYRCVQSQHEPYFCFENARNRLYVNFRGSSKRPSLGPGTCPKWQLLPILPKTPITILNHNISPFNQRARTFFRSLNHSTEIKQNYDISHSKVLGTGASSEVVRVRHKITSVRYALKTFYNREGGGGEKQRKYYLNEIEILRQIDHPNVIRYVQAPCLVPPSDPSTNSPTPTQTLPSLRTWLEPPHGPRAMLSGQPPPCPQQPASQARL